MKHKVHQQQRLEASSRSLIQPFGEVCFENESLRLGDHWDNYYFEHLRFVAESLDPEKYLIVGRRGSGKSSLLEHFKYQTRYKNAGCIIVNNDHDYYEEMFRVSSELHVQSSRLKKLVSVWEHVFWQLAFTKLREREPRLDNVLDPIEEHAGFASIVKSVVAGVLSKFAMENASAVIDAVSKRLQSTRMVEAREMALAVTSKYPLFIAIDSREQYEVRSQEEMQITAALIECASRFNLQYAGRGLHIKVCVADEVFPYIKEDAISNTAKHIRDPLFITWRPKDLMRLICWRLHKYLVTVGLPHISEQEVNWDSFEDIHAKIWLRHFDEKLLNRCGIEERSWPYVLRHTHLKPRQLVQLCNRIARLAGERNEFPRFTGATIRDAVRQCEVDLADELINSYRSVYPRIGEIISALEGAPVEFKANFLDRMAHRTAGQWPDRTYSAYEFKKLVMELGVVGRRRGYTDEKTCILRADFEYFFDDRIYLTESDHFVIHPMCCVKLNSKMTDPKRICIYPFPENKEFIN